MVEKSWGNAEICACANAESLLLEERKTSIT